MFFFFFPGFIGHEFKDLKSSKASQYKPGQCQSTQERSRSSMGYCQLLVSLSLSQLPLENNGTLCNCRRVSLGFFFNSLSLTSLQRSTWLDCLGILPTTQYLQHFKQSSINTPLFLKLPTAFLQFFVIQIFSFPSSLGSATINSCFSYFDHSDEEIVIT